METFLENVTEPFLSEIHKVLIYFIGKLHFHYLFKVMSHEEQHKT